MQGLYETKCTKTGKCAVCGRLPSHAATSWKFGKHRPRKTRMRHFHTFNKQIGEKMAKFDDAIPPRINSGLKKKCTSHTFPVSKTAKSDGFHHLMAPYKAYEEKAGSSTIISRERLTSRDIEFHISLLNKYQPSSFS